MEPISSTSSPSSFPLLEKKRGRRGREGGHFETASPPFRINGRAPMSDEHCLTRESLEQGKEESQRDTNFAFKKLHSFFATRPVICCEENAKNGGFSHLRLVYSLKRRQTVCFFLSSSSCALDYLYTVERKGILGGDIRCVPFPVR